MQMYKKSLDTNERNLAYQHLYKAVSLDSTAVNAYLLLGELLFMDELYDESYNYFETAAHFAPGNIIAVDNLKKLSLMLEDRDLKPISNLLDEALRERNITKLNAAYRQVEDFLAEHPKSLIGRNLKGNMLGRGYGLLDSSIHVYEGILADDPTFASAYENMGIAYAVKKDFISAEACLLRAQQLVPDNMNVKNNLVSLYLDKGDIEKAEAMKQQIAAMTAR